MAEYSLYKSLELPSSTEHYNIGVFNKNTKVIDSELHKLDLKNENQDNLFATKEGLSDEISRATTQENNISENLSNHIMDKFNPHNITKYQVELGNVDNTSDINKPVSTAQQTAIDEALYQSNNYTDAKIAELINGAPETLDTLKEVADAIEEVKNNLNISKEHVYSQHARVDATKVEKSETNGNIKINGVETNVYTPSSSTELPLTTSLDASEEGMAALDSTVGKVLKDEIDEINSNLGGLSFYEDTNGNKYVVGADAVPKKLGSGKITKLGAKSVSIPVIEAAGGAKGSVTWTVPQGTKAEQVLVYIESYSVSAGATNGGISSSLTYSLSGTTLTATVFGKRLDITVIPVLNAIIVS